MAAQELRFVKNTNPDLIPVLRSRHQHNSLNRKKYCVGRVILILMEYFLCLHRIMPKNARLSYGEVVLQCSCLQTLGSRLGLILATSKRHILLTVKKRVGKGNKKVNGRQSHLQVQLVFPQAEAGLVSIDIAAPKYIQIKW